MTRRKTLAAISAAIATPVHALHEDYGAGKKYGPHLGLTPTQVEVRDALAAKVKSALDNLFGAPGPGALADLALLEEALVAYGGSHEWEFGGLFSAIFEVLQRDTRVVVVPEKLIGAVRDFTEASKAGVLADEGKRAFISEATHFATISSAEQVAELHEKLGAAFLETQKSQQAA